MPDTATVKRALSRLAAQSADAPAVDGGWFGGDDYRTVVTAADDAVESLAAAVDFLDNDGLDRLDAAIEAADDAGDYAAARRGRRARETLADFRRAVRSDQFHHGRGTTLGGGAQGDENDTGDTYG
ncbi:hypothetical protein [Halorientalis regularis]|uniref:Uncharacterized protein n=1 Tax=Halorientalis regularis TaxID=660518 RepID=A0A1G7PDU3_9EURY|nr:hypothetical protein [Halorientalis regularis]SDF83809.1 hypothetical protein SAMN05216218_11060 [Halorientalis regularis]